MGEGRKRSPEAEHYTDWKAQAAPAAPAAEVFRIS